MQKLFTIIFILSFILTCGFVATHAFPETLIIDTNDGQKKELYIPDNYDELREAYIEMSKLYIGESLDLELSLIKIDALLTLMNEMDELTITLRETNRKLIDELIKVIEEKEKRDLFQGYLSGYIERGWESNFNGGIKMDLTISEKALIGLGVSFQSIQLSVGWRIF